MITILTDLVMTCSVRKLFLIINGLERAITLKRFVDIIELHELSINEYIY